MSQTRSTAPRAPEVAAGRTPEVPSGHLVTEAVRALARRLEEADLGSLDDTARLDLLRAMEDLSRRSAGAGARLQVGFAESQVAEQAARGVRASRRGLAVADDLAAARKTSPYWGSRDLASSRALVGEMPCTLRALETGVISGYQARIITEATTCLDREDRAEVDRRLAGQLPGASSAEIGKAVRGLTYEVDPAGFVERARKAAKDRGVSMRPAPDVMGLLSARLPAPQAVAVYKALKDHAHAAKASGDPRTKNQIMADELYYRLTGRRVVEGVDVEVGLVMTDASLFDGASDAADLEGYGPIPADLARDLLRHEGDEATTADPAETGDEATSAAPAADATPLCPEGIRCKDWDCQLLHGAYPEGQPAPTPPSPSPSAPGSAPSPGSARRPRSTDDDAGREKGPAADTGGLRAAKAWVRRLYLDEVTGQLSCRDPRRRFFTGSLRAFVIARDRTCRNSWCGAPIRDVDHVVRHADGGETSADDGQGLCQRCNLARERERHSPVAPEDFRSPPPLLPAVYGRSAAGVVQPTVATRPASKGASVPSGTTRPTGPRPRRERAGSAAAGGGGHGSTTGDDPADPLA